MRCWQCGAEPTEVVETTSFSDPQPTFMPARWPASDHEHALRPPTPDELSERGRNALRRIQEAS